MKFTRAIAPHRRSGAVTRKQELRRVYGTDHSLARLFALHACILLVLCETSGDADAWAASAPCRCDYQPSFVPAHTQPSMHYCAGPRGVIA